MANKAELTKEEVQLLRTLRKRQVKTDLSDDDQDDPDTPYNIDTSEE